MNTSNPLLKRIHIFSWYQSLRFVNLFFLHFCLFILSFLSISLVFSSSLPWTSHQQHHFQHNHYVPHTLLNFHFLGHLDDTLLPKWQIWRKHDGLIKLGLSDSCPKTSVPLIISNRRAPPMMFGFESMTSFTTPP